MLLNGRNGSDSDDLRIGSFESGSGLVASAEDFGDVFLVESVEGVPNFQGTEPESFDVATFESQQAQEPSTVETQESKSVGDYVEDIFGNLWDALKTTGEAAAQGAIEGATAASQGATTGANVGARTTTLSTTTLLLGAVILILLLRR